MTLIELRIVSWVLKKEIRRISKISLCKPSIWVSQGDTYPNRKPHPSWCWRTHEEFNLTFRPNDVSKYLDCTNLRLDNKYLSCCLWPYLAHERTGDLCKNKISSRRRYVGWVVLNSSTRKAVWIICSIRFEGLHCEIDKKVNVYVSLL